MPNAHGFRALQNLSAQQFSVDLIASTAGKNRSTWPSPSQPYLEGFRRLSVAPNASIAANKALDTDRKWAYARFRDDSHFEITSQLASES